MAVFPGRRAGASRFGGRRITYFDTDEGPATYSQRPDGTVWLSTESGVSGPAEQFGNARPVYAASAQDRSQGDGSVARQRQRTLGERFTTTAEDAALRNPLQALGRFAATRGPDTFSLNDPTTGQPVEFRTFGAQARDTERQRRATYDQSLKGDRWTDARGGPVGKAVAGAATLGGAFAGGASDPLNVMGGWGRTILGRIAAEGAVNAAGDAVAQGADIGSGVQDKYSLMQTASAAAIGAGLQSGLEIAPRGIDAAGRVIDQGSRQATRFAGRLVEGAQAASQRLAPNPVPGFDGRAFDTGPMPQSAPLAGQTPPARRAGAPNPRAGRGRASTGQVRQAPPQIQAAIDQAAAGAGVSRDFLTRLAERESSFNPNARADTSSATGLYQFTDATWLGTLARHGEALGVRNALALVRNDPDRALGLRTDAALNARAAAMLTQDNARSLREVLGRDPNDAELYSAHFLGEAGARRLATADPRANAVELFPEAAAANRSIFFEGQRPRSVAEVQANFARTFGGSGSTRAAASGARVYPGRAVDAGEAQATPGLAQPLQRIDGPARPDYAALAAADMAHGTVASPRRPAPTSETPAAPITEAGFPRRPAGPIMEPFERIGPDTTPPPMRAPEGPRVSRIQPQDNFLSPGAEGFRVDLPNSTNRLNGVVSGEIRPDGTWRVRTAELPQAERGQGRAVQAYAQAAQEAFANGSRLTSDGEVSPAAARVWQAMERRGFRIEQNPAATLQSRAGLPDTMGMGDVSLRTPDGSPVFRVVDVPPTPERIGLDATASAPVFPGRVIEGGFPTAPRQFAGRLIEPSPTVAPEFRQQYAPAPETYTYGAGFERAAQQPGGVRFAGRMVEPVQAMPARLAMQAGEAGAQRLPIDLSAYGERIGQSLPSSGQSVSGLREAPRPGAVARGEGTGTYAGQTVSGLARDLRNALGITQRQGRMSMKRAEGEYDTGSAVIRTKAVQELDVLAHEATHALEFKRNNPALQAALRDHTRELEAMAYPGAAPGVTRQEGFAEFGRWYVTNPDYARQAAPNFYDAFERALAQDAPAVGANLKAIQQAYQDLLRSDSIEVAKASVAYTGRQTPLRELAREFREKGPLSTIGRLADGFYTAFVDGQHPINIAVRRLSEVYRENTGKALEIRRADDPYSLSRLAREAYAAGHNDIVFGVTPYRGLDPEGPSLSQALETADIATTRGKMKLDALKEFDAYLIARRAIHEWDRFSRGELPRPPDRNTRQFHEQVIADAEARHPTWSDAAGQVYAWLGGMWRKRFEAGLITEEAYQNGLTNHPDYVPFQRDVSDKGAALGRRGGAMQNVGGVRTFEGSTRDILSPLSTMMRQAYELNAIIRKNDVLLALDRLADLAGPGSGAIVERLPALEAEAISVNAADALRKTADEMGLSGRDLADIDKLADAAGDTVVTLFRQAGITPKLGEAIVFTWKGGKPQPLLLPDGPFGKEMFDAITGMSKDQQNFMVEMAAVPTQLLRYGVTLSPEFQVANVIRDQIATWINTDVGFRPGFDTIRGGASELSQDAWAKRYATAGGMRGGVNVAATQKPFPRNDAEATAQLQHLKMKGLKVRRFASWRGLAEVTDLSETSTRIGVFRQAFEKAKRQGLDDYAALIEAGFTSRDYLDFGRRGSKMVSAARLVTFLNAALQGLDKTARVLGANGNLGKAIAPLFGGQGPQTAAQRASIAHAQKAWVKVAALGALGLGLRMLYADDPEYQGIGDQLRATHWVFRMNGEWVFVPKPFELATISNILERGYEGVALGDPTAPERLLSDLAHTVVPPYEMPLLAVPFQIARNRSGLGVPIIPDHLKGTVDPAQQFNAYTSQLGRLIGQTLKVSPAVVDHIITGFGGTLGRYGLQGTNLAYETVTGAPRVASGPEDAFLVRRFVRDINRGSTSQAGFWDEVSRDGGDMTQALGTFRQIASEGKDAEAVAYLNKLDAPTRAYVRASYFTDEGSQKLHPLVRARESLGVIGDLRRQVRDGSLLDMSGAAVQLSPDQRRQVDDTLAEMATYEMRNALVASGVKGWAQRSYRDHRQADARLERASPEVAQALRTLQAVNRVPPEEPVLNLWPQLRSQWEAKMPEQAAIPMMRLRRAQGGLPGRLLEMQRTMARRREEAQ